MNSRRKGHDFERRIAALMRTLYPRVERTQEGSQADRDGADLANTGRLVMQCKRGRKYAPLTVLHKLASHHPPPAVPVLVTKADNGPVLVAITLGDFLDLLERGHHANADL